MQNINQTSQADRWMAECDVAFIVALREEMGEINIFQDAEPEPIENDLDLVIHRRTISTGSGQAISVLTLLVGDQGPEAAGNATTKFLQRVNTKLLILLGISGRISNDCKLGDVILAEVCDNSLYRAKIKNQKVLPGGKEWPVDALAKPLFSAIENSPPFYTYAGIKTDVLENLRAKGYVGQIPRTHYGPVCTTPFLVDDLEFAEWLKASRNRNILATDMESAAVVQAAHESGVRNGRVLVIRGVSDPADGSKKDFDSIASGVLRRIAIKNAAQLASHCITHLLTFANPEVDFRGIEQERPIVEEKLAAYKDTLNLLKQIASKIRGGASEIEVCEWAHNEREKTPLTAQQIEVLAQSAYKQGIRKDSDEFSPVLQTIESISRDYLVASWIMDRLAEKEVSEILLETLSNVYPERVNFFCKAMLAIYPDEKRVVDTLIAAYEDRSKRKSRKVQQTQEKAKAHICYLLGRLRSPQQKKRAADALHRWRMKISKVIHRVVGGTYQLDRIFSTVEAPEQRLLLRTICISLILLEQQGESEIYVQTCLRNKEFDSLNRGFHLEYYGDIDYDPRESMSNEDNKGSCTKTFKKLLKKLSASYAANKPYPLRDVELQTLLSLAQHRLACGYLSQEHRASLVDLLKKYPATRLTSIKLLQSFCAMMQDHLDIPEFKRIHLLQKLYELKKFPRTGWNDCDSEHQRKTPNPESVLSHTAGGLLLIHFLLPDRLSKEERNEIGAEDAKAYSKQDITSIFLTHDFAEAYIGDLTPKQRNDVTKAKEVRVNSIIDVYSTYPDFHDGRFFYLWNDFENYISINGKIAREVDALENLLQLNIESEYPDVSISDLESWKDELIKRIETPIGKRILRIIME